MNDRPTYPWSEGDALFADELNAAIANAASLANPAVPAGGSIQAAIDALPATGGEVRLSPNATYVITTAISSSKTNVRISAPSWNTVIRRGPSFGGAVLQLDGAGCLIEGMTFDGNGAVVGAISSGACEAAITGANSRITNCQFINSSATMNISCAGAGCRVDHCTITGMGISLSTERGFGVWAVNNVQVFVEHNRITGTGIEAIGINGPGSVATGNIISRCHCWSASGGAQLWSYPYTATGSGTVVSNNNIGQGQHTTSGGIELSGNNVTCTGNTIVNQYAGGIQVNSGHGITITGNTILNTGLDMSGAQDGITVLAGVTDFVISGNRIGDDQTTPTMRWPIVIQAGASDRYTISGNLLGPNSDPNGRLVDGGTGTTKIVQGNTGSDTVVPVGYSTAALSLGPVNQVFHLQYGDTMTITSIAAGAGVKGSLRVALPNAAYTFQAGNNIGNTVTTTANVPLIMACDETGKWWLR